jgi:D-alanyl-D-alanine carboxypeptidase
MNSRLLRSTLLVLMAFAGWCGPAFAGQYSALVVEPESGRILYEKDADGLRHPASVTKMMTLYIVFEALEKGEITLNTPLEVSRNAVLRPPSRLGVKAGDTLRVEDAILALVTRSANDAATVIAENLGGTEAAFGEMMTAKARALGMKDSVFKNASGLPDPGQWTTARDMYRLGRALIYDFPRYYPYFSTPRFYYHGQGFDNHNHLMETYPGMDGIKTGFINSSGFNLVASAKRSGHRLIGVVFGGPSAVGRDRHMREILDDGFAQLGGAAPRGVVAAFERATVPRAAHERIDVGSPHLTFGNPEKFKRKWGRHASAPQPESHGSAKSKAGTAAPKAAKPPKVAAPASAKTSCSGAKAKSAACKKK